MSTRITSTRFDHFSGTESNKQQEIDILRAKNDLLKQKNARLMEEVAELKDRVKEQELIISGDSNMDENPNEFCPILLNYLVATRKNMKKEKNGYRYENLHEFFALMYFMGPHFFRILTDNLLIPTYKTASTYKKQLFEEFGIEDCVFNGEIENVITIIQKFMPQDYSGKAVLQVDAAYVTPYVKIKKDGTVQGLLYITEIDESEAEMYLKEEEEFLEFIQNNIDQVIQAEFGIIFAPLDPQYKPFSIACLPSTSGKASLEMLAQIEQLILELNECYPIVGLGTDGDNTYSKYSDLFIYKIIDDFDNFLELNSSEIIEKYDLFIHFSDPYHLTKRDRYRKAALLIFFISPTDLKNLRYVDDLLSLGIPPYILDNSRGRKMEDDFPKKLFNMQVIQKIMDSEDFHLLISMLPSTLLLESLHEEKLSLQATIDYLLLGASIVLVYYIMQKNVIEKEQKIYRKNPSGYKLKMCFTNEWCKQYIFTTIGIASLMITEEELNCGACSSHYQEHSIANIRRHCKQDNSHMKFDYSKVFLV